MPKGIYPRTEITRLKMSKARKKVGAPWMKGKKFSVKTRLKISLAKMGKHSSPKTEFKKGRKVLINYWKGKKFSEEHKKKISIGNKGKTRSIEARKRYSESNKTRWVHGDGREDK